MDLQRIERSILVVSPLVSIMEDQKKFLRKFGISAGSIREDKALNLKIEKGECSVVFSSPASLLLGNDRWRRFPGKTAQIFCVNSFVFHKFIMCSHVTAKYITKFSLFL